MPKSDFKSEMVKRSLIQMGNNSRIKRVIEKAMAGQDVTIAYSGGSITSGYLGGNQGNYASQSFDYFKKQFGSEFNLHYINTGYPGGNSILGLIRAEMDVLSHQPDMIVIEFAVNDTKERTSREAFESLVVRCLQAASNPAVILLLAIAEAGYSCQGHMQAIGEHYELPMISCGDALMPEIAAGRMRWSDFCSDYIHPHEKGHRIITEFMIHYYNQAAQAKPDPEYELPIKAIFSREFEKMKLLDERNAEVEQLGSFQGKDFCIGFGNGWKHTMGMGKESFRLPLICRNLFIVHKETNQLTAGNAEVYIDGKLKITLHGYGVMGFDNPVVNLLLHESVAELHIIELKMAHDDEEKEFSIMAFGYNE